MDTVTLIALSLALGLLVGLALPRSHRTPRLTDPLYISNFTALEAVRQGARRNTQEPAWARLRRRVLVALQRKTVVWRSRP